MNKITKVNLYMPLLLIAMFLTGFSITQAQSVPSVSTGPATLMSSRSVMLNMDVNPKGNNTQIWFEIGTSQLFGSNRGHQSIGNGSSSVAIRVGLINLSLGTTYYYRAAAQNSGGVSHGETKSFTTSTESNSGSGANSSNSNGSSNTSNISSGSGNSTTTDVGTPLVASNGPASVSINSATVNGSINPNNSQTNFWFEFGPTASLGLTTSVQSLSAGNSWQLVSGSLTGLDSGKPYYYRVVAQNGYGIRRSDLVVFTTSVGSMGSGGQVFGAVSGSGSSGNKSTRIVSGGGQTIDETVNNNSELSNDSNLSISLEYPVSDNGDLVLVADDAKPKPGEEFGHTIVYKNTSFESFNEVNLKVIIPVGTSYIGSSVEPSGIYGNVLEFDLGTIGPNSQGVSAVVVKIKDEVSPGVNLIFTSVLSYINQSGVSRTSTAYMIVKAGTSGQGSSESSLLGSLFGSVLGSEGSLWLVALILVVSMSVLVYRLLKIRKAINSGSQDDIDIDRIPATFEPVEVPMGRSDIFQPV